MAGKDLRAEVENYSKTYGQILVGIHNDLVDYKNKVNDYSRKSTETLSKCTKLLNRSEALKSDTLEVYSKIENHQKEIDKRVYEHESYLKSYEIKFKEKVDVLYKFNQDFKKGIAINEKLSSENLELKLTIESLKDTLDKVHINLRESMTLMEDRLNKEGFKLKISIESMNKRLGTIEKSLIIKENQISNLETYRIIFIVALSVLSLVMIMTNLL